MHCCDCILAAHTDELLHILEVSTSSHPAPFEGSPLMMLGQENKTKHLNVCLVQHRLEEGSEVV
jgi:hypothetical protein